MARQSRLVPGRPCVSREARCTASIISVTRMSNSSPLYLQRSWDQRGPEPSFSSDKREKISHVTRSKLVHYSSIGPGCSYLSQPHPEVLGPSSLIFLVPYSC